MFIKDLQTPAIILDLDVMEHNLKKYEDLALAHHKQIWPMTKTHKSTELLKLQFQYGATGFLGGTLDECEAACEEGYENIMYAYPVATACSARRVIELEKKCHFIIRIDNLDAAKFLNEMAKQENICIYYTVIVDSGLHRFGLKPDKVKEFLLQMKELEFMIFSGISSHPGHVYCAENADEVGNYAMEEAEAIRIAVEQVKSMGMEAEIISSGSTPTFSYNIADENLNIYHPGNYIFHDCIQISNHTAKEEECALQVVASIISHPAENVFICDAGAKCLGLDKGAHGNASVVGYGKVIGHPEIIVESLSEEVGKLRILGNTDLKIGDTIRIIPNHSCSTANLTDYYIGVRGERIERLIPVNIRGNKTTKGISF